MQFVSESHTILGNRNIRPICEMQREPQLWLVGSMQLTPSQLATAFKAACFPLQFLLSEECRENPRKQMAGLSDAAIFHRWMSLFWGLDGPEVLAVLAPEERTTVMTFKALFDALPWNPIDTHPFISDLPKKGEELADLLPAAKALHQLLERRISCS